jgi:branched-chain amino acid transport system ATP-binding protein
MVLHDVELNAPAGEVTLVAGANGAGKSTLMWLLMGLLRPMRGSIRLGSVELTSLSVRERARRHVSLIPEGRGLFPSLTVGENLRVAATSMGLGRVRTRQAIDQAAGTFPIIRERMEQKVSELSGGQQQMLAVARGLISDPQALLLDEPSTGLAPIVWKEVLMICRRLAQSGKVVLLVEQRILDAIPAADRCVVLHRGRVVRDGPAKEFADQPQVFHDYIAMRAGE